MEKTIKDIIDCKHGIVIDDGYIKCDYNEDEVEDSKKGDNQKKENEIENFKTPAPPISSWYINRDKYGGGGDSDELLAFAVGLAFFEIIICIIGLIYIMCHSVSFITTSYMIVSLIAILFGLILLFREND